MFEMGWLNEQLESRCVKPNKGRHREDFFWGKKRKLFSVHFGCFCDRIFRTSAYMQYHFGSMFFLPRIGLETSHREIHRDWEVILYWACCSFNQLDPNNSLLLVFFSRNPWESLKNICNRGRVRMKDVSLKEADLPRKELWERFSNPHRRNQQPASA